MFVRVNVRGSRERERERRERGEQVREKERERVMEEKENVETLIYRSIESIKSFDKIKSDKSIDFST